MNGLAQINVELTSRCNKSCHMCGRRKLEKEYPELCNWGSMPLNLVCSIAKQVPKGVDAILHRDGEPLLYPKLEDAIKAFHGDFVAFNTNGILLMENLQAINLLSTVTISIIPDDPIGVDQYKIITEFLETKPDLIVVLRVLGNDIANEGRIRILKDTYLNVRICRRVLHAPEGSFDYEKDVTIPETGVCREMLHNLAVDRFGNVYPCVRYDPLRKNLLGNLHTHSLETIWESGLRHQWIRYHIEGRRDLVPLCNSCHFYGIPKS